METATSSRNLPVEGRCTGLVAFPISVNFPFLGQSEIRLLI